MFCPYSSKIVKKTGSRVGAENILPSLKIRNPPLWAKSVLPLQKCIFMVLGE
jgi:hypothetical protein